MGNLHFKKYGFSRLPCFITRGKTVSHEDISGSSLTSENGISCLSFSRIRLAFIRKKLSSF